MSLYNPLRGKRLSDTIKKLVEKKRVFIKMHAIQRMHQRNVSIEELLQVLKNSNHEEGHSGYSMSMAEWNYSLRGRTKKGRILRVIVALEETPEDQVAVITVIDPAI